MAASAHPGATAPAPGERASAEQARRQLGQLIADHGLAICADPWRCEALLRDMCGGSRREIFWLMAALKENVVADIQAARRHSTEPVMVARLAHKLAEDLGLAAEPAQWTAVAWVEAVGRAPEGVPAPEVHQNIRPPLPAWPEGNEPAAGISLPQGLDGRWISLCLAGVALSGLALAVVARVALWPGASDPKGWLTNTAVLAVGLAGVAAGEFAVMRGVRAWRPRRRPAPAQAAWALAPELLLLMAQPATVIASLLVWFGGWLGAWHYYGAGLSFAFHLGRLVQTMMVAAFLLQWVDWMTRIQGQVAATLVHWPVQP